MSRRFLPREHGAYGQLGVPLAAALASGRPGLAALGWATVAIALFLAHEPLLQLVMRRGGVLRETARSMRRLEHSLPGELVLSTLLAGLAVPVAIAAGVAPATALWTWAAWAVAFAAVTCAIHAAVLRRPRSHPRLASALGVALIPVAIALAALRPTPALAVLPLVLLALVVHLVMPPPHCLRVIGWTAMTATVAAGTWMVIEARVG